MSACRLHVSTELSLFSHKVGRANVASTCRNLQIGIGLPATRLSGCMPALPHVRLVESAQPQQAAVCRVLRQQSPDKQYS